MSDAEYGDHYAVYMTPDKGVKFLTNSLGIDTINLLCTRDDGVTSLATIMNVPVTTMQSNLTRLQRMGLVGMEKDPDDKRKVKYHNLSYCLFRDGKPEPWMSEFKEFSARQIILGNNPWNSAIAMIVIVMLENGIDTRPVLFELGNSVAALHKGEFIGLDEKGILDLAIKVFGISDDFSFDMDLGDEFVLKIRSNGGPIYRIMYIVNAIIGFLFAALPYAQGFFYTGRTSMLLSDDRSEVSIRAKKKEGVVHLKHLPPMWRRTPEFYRIDNPLIVVRSGDRSMMIGNPTMVSIIDALSMGARSIDSVSESLGMSATTVNAAMKKLMAIGLVETDGKARGAKYSFNGSILISLENQTRDYSGWLSEVMSTYLSRVTNISDFAYWYTSASWSLSGLDYEPVIRDNGRYIARKILRMFPDITADEFIRKACRCSVRETVRASVVTYIPVKIKVECIDDPRYPQYPELSRNFFWEIVHEGLRKMTGEELYVDVELVMVPAGLWNSEPSVSSQVS